MKHFVYLFTFITLYLAMPTAFAVQIKVKNNQGEPIKGAAVYIDNLDASQINAITASTVVSQQDKKFQPYITVVQKGQFVDFDNKDDITHHIYSAVGKNKFSFKIHKGENPKRVSFDHLGQVPMGCNIHDWMTGHILVVDTPIFGTTDENGIVVFPQITQGLVHVWHPQFAKADSDKQQEIQGKATLEFKLNEKMRAVPQQVSADDFDFLDEY